MAIVISAAYGPQHSEIHPYAFELSTFGNKTIHIT